VTYYNVNRHINPTNVCVAHCKLCAFGRDPTLPAHTRLLWTKFTNAPNRASAKAATGEFHIVGGLHPEFAVEYFLELIGGLKQRHRNVHLKAFTMVEVHYFARIAKAHHRRNFEKNESGRSGLLPGRRCGNFPSARAPHHLRPQSQRPNVAHTRTQSPRSGLASNATMLYGHVETEEERVDHLVKLRELQDVTHGS